MKLTTKQLVSGALSLLTVGAMVAPSLVSAQSTLFGLEYATKSGLGTQDIRDTIFTIINIILSFLGIIAIIIVIYGGFTWMTAMGNADKTGEARTMIIAGIVGLGIVLASYAIASFVVNQLYGATTGTL